MDEYQKTAISIASEVTKQLITLATGIVAIGATFAKDLFSADAPRDLLIWSAGLFMFSILFGLGTLMSFAGGLEKDTSPTRCSIYKPGIVFCQILQIVLFVFAMFVFLWYAGTGVNFRSKPALTVPKEGPPAKDKGSKGNTGTGNWILIKLQASEVSAKL